MGFLTGKHAGLPAWAWIAIAAGGIVAGLWLRNRLGSGQSAASSTIPSGTTATASGTTYPDLGAAASGGGAGGVAGADGSTGGYSAADVVSAYNQGGTDANANFQSSLNLVSQLQQLLGVTPGISGITGSSGGYTGPLSTPATPPPAGVTGTSTPAVTTGAHSTTTALTKAAEPFGGIASVRTLKNGATLTTYRSGRQVEQAKGRKPYLVRA